MAKQKKTVHRVQMTDWKRNIIRQLLEVPSRFMRKIICRLRLNEVSRQ